jgi:hypothetical protein
MIDNVPFGEGKEFIIDVKVNSRGTHDIYIDDLVGLGLDLTKSDNLKRSKQAPLLATDTHLMNQSPTTTWQKSTSLTRKVFSRRPR